LFVSQYSSVSRYIQKVGKGSCRRNSFARWQGSGQDIVTKGAVDLQVKRPGFIKVVADPERRVLTGAVAVGPESGEWLQQLTLAIRAETPIEVLLDVIPPYPTFSEGVFLALRELNLDL